MCDLYISGDDSPPTLSTESVFEATKGVAKWKELCSSSCGFKIPRAKYDEIEADQQLSNTKERKKAVIRFWLEHDPAPSWRRLIVGLDEIEAHEVAEKIRKYAEPLRGNVTKPIVLYLYYMLTKYVLHEYDVLSSGLSDLCPLDQSNGKHEFDY